MFFYLMFLMDVWFTKEINRLISKGIYIFSFDIFNGFLKPDILKISILSKKKFAAIDNL